MRAAFFTCIALLATWAAAQAVTLTTTDDLGETVVEAIYTDPNLLIPTTSIISTVLAVATTSTPDQGGAPVQQPAPTATGAGTPTIYTYTTTNAAGVTTAVIDTFTPTYYQSEVSPSPYTGTVLNYSSWLAMIGTNTAPAAQAVSGARSPIISTGWYGVAITALSGMLGGAWLVLV